MDGGKAVLVLGSGDGHGTLAWTPSAVRAFDGHTLAINAVAVTPDGAKLVTASTDKSARVFEVATGKTLQTLAGHGDAVRAVAISKDGQTVATASLDKSARTWNLADGKPKLVYPLGAAGVSVAFAPDGKSLVVGLGSDQARVLDLAEADPAKAEEPHCPATVGAHGPWRSRPMGTRS